MAKLRNKNATPQELESVRADYVKKFAETKGNSIDPKLLASMDAWAKDPTSAEAQMANDNGFKALLDSELAKNPDVTPDMFGQIIGQVYDVWNNMDGMSKMGLMIGVPAAMIGLLGGNGISMLIGALGLGVAGAGSGLFGSTAQQFTNDAGSYLGSMTGMPDNNAAPAQPAASTPAVPPATAAQESQAPAPAATAATPTSASPGNLIQQLQQDPDGVFSAAIKSDIATQKELLGYLFDLPKAQADAIYARLSDKNKRQFLDALHGWSGYGVGKSMKRDNDLQRFRSWFPKNAAINIMRKAARCWAGYEPVPGAKAYSEGSCRPKGSKKTQKEVAQGKKHEEKKAYGPKPTPGANPYNNPDFNQKGEYVGSYSAVPFDSAHARQWLGLPAEDKRTDMQVWDLLKKTYRNQHWPHEGVRDEFAEYYKRQMPAPPREPVRRGPRTAQPAPVTPAQPPEPQPQQVAKPAAPVTSPAPKTPAAATAPRPQTPVTSPSATPPSSSSPYSRPTMSQMPPTSQVRPRGPAGINPQTGSSLPGGIKLPQVGGAGKPAGPAGINPNSGSKLPSLPIPGFGR
jgi:predicted lipid-binding transport protein (Tim44 family)